jgi:hypothetical protein
MLILNHRVVFLLNPTPSVFATGIVAEIAAQVPQEDEFIAVMSGLRRQEVEAQHVRPTDSQERGGIIPSAMTPNQTPRFGKFNFMLHRIACFCSFSATR